MQFKIKSTKRELSFTFLALILLATNFDKEGILLISLISSAFHELVHIAFIIAFGGRISVISFSILGGNIKRSKALKLTNIKEFFISIGAPTTNIIVGALLLLFKLNLWGYINLIIGIFNILPFYDFDGGRGLFYLLSNYLDYSSVIKILNFTSILSAILVSSFTATVFFNSKTGFSMLILCVYMIIALFKNLKTEDYNKNI